MECTDNISGDTGVLPISPGGISCAFGVLILGSIQGFIYNYVGICIGSIAAFLIARQYGLNYVTKMSNKKNSNKYIEWLKKPGFERLYSVYTYFSTSSSM